MTQYVVVSTYDIKCTLYFKYVEHHWLWMNIGFDIWPFIFGSSWCDGDVKVTIIKWSGKQKNNDSWFAVVQW